MEEIKISLVEDCKIDVEELIRDFKVLKVDNLKSYLKEIWKDLALRSDDKTKGISKVTFSKYYDLPGIIQERLFSVFDKNNNHFIEYSNFIDGMLTLFSETYEKMLKFIFNLYDFDKDNYISKEDIRIVLSYIPLNTKSKVNSNKLKFEKEEYKDRVESQDELFNLLEKSFKNIDRIDFDKFTEIVENVCSEIFLYILIFLLERRPFSKNTLGEFENVKNKIDFKSNSSHLKVSNSLKLNYLIASPNLTSKFSPSIAISKSPSMKNCKIEPISIYCESTNILNKYTKNTQDLIKNVPINFDDIEKTEDSNYSEKKSPIKRNRINLKNLDESSINISSPINILQNNSSKISNEQTDYISDDNIDEIKIEGSLYKITRSKKLKLLCFKLLGKDIYFFKIKNNKSHRGIHNLSGVFITEEKETIIDNTKFYCFSIIYPNKSKLYLVENEQDYKKWVKAIRKVTGYCSLKENYDVKAKIGKGKFGLIRLGIHKQTGRQVAIKSMDKRQMTDKDLELVKMEIEILKIVQQPNIVQLYDVLETSDFIYIIMEYCSGGDLFTYLEKRKFRLKEFRAATLIHKLSTAIFYLHSYGIAHRDLKPENILMTNESDEADIRVLDFGLSKIIGPSETCIEPFGTLSYVAPEVLLEQPYTKAVDLWSIGIITYLMLCGCLPFDDHHSEKEVARQTIYDPVPYHSTHWKNLTCESKNFVNNLLQKDPSKRMKIKECLDNPWIIKFNQSNLTDKRRDSKDKQVSTFLMYTTCYEKDI